jgi:hypothetical protein
MSTSSTGIPPTTSSSTLMPNQRRSWLGRNWGKLLAAAFLCMVLFVAAILTLVVGAIRGSDVAKEAVTRAQSNALLAQRLGNPISEGWFVGGSINVQPGSGDADLSVPISGPKGKGTVYVKAQKSVGVWAYSFMVATIEGSTDKIDLLDSGTAAQANAPVPAPQPVSDLPTQPAQVDPSAATAAAPEPAAADPAPAPAAPASPAAASGVIASGQYSNDPNLRCDLLELKRVSGNALLARWRIVNTGAKPIAYDFGWDDIYYIDPAGNKKFNNLNIDGKRILDMWWGTLRPGEQHMMWAKYPAPPPTSKRVSLNVPKFAPFEDAPVSE